jgi:AraC-like DNA-binding protein
MNYQEYPPHPQLRNSILCYSTLEEHHTPEREVHCFYPECRVRLAFYEGDAYVSLTDGSLEFLPKSYLIGLPDQPLSIVSKGLTKVLCVEFYPWGAVQLLGLSEGLQTVAFKKFEVDANLSRQIQRLLAVDALDEAIHVLEEWLLARHALYTLEPNSATRAATMLYVSGGQQKVGEIAEAVGISRRQLERLFLTEVGITPKALANVIRFDTARQRIWLEPKRSLTELAYELGYADQPHFSRDFRAFAHISPQTFSKQIQTFLERQRVTIDSERQLISIS